MGGGNNLQGAPIYKGGQQFTKGGQQFTLGGGNNLQAPPWPNSCRLNPCN